MTVLVEICERNYPGTDVLLNGSQIRMKSRVLIQLFQVAVARSSRGEAVLGEDDNLFQCCPGLSVQIREMHSVGKLFCSSGER